MSFFEMICIGVGEQLDRCIAITQRKPVWWNSPENGFAPLSCVIHEKKMSVDAERIGDLLDVSKRDAAALTLNGADVGAMEPAFVRKRLLRQAELLAIMPHVAREDVQNIHAYLHKPRGD